MGESRHFIRFCMPPNIQLEDKAGLNEWLERMMFLFEDLKWLLSQKCDLFWSQITMDESWHQCFESFLQNAPRSFDLQNLPEGCRTALNRVSRLYLLVIKRMSLHDEAQVFSSQIEYGEFIYENYHFDAAKLLDICAIFYRPDCRIQDMLKEIFQNIFQSQPSYYDDFSNILATVVSTLETMESRMAVKKSPSKSTEYSKKLVQEREAQDMISFAYDMIRTFENLLLVHPNISHVFMKGRFIGRLVHTCESLLPELLKLVYTNKKKFIYMKKEIERGLLFFINTVIRIGLIERVERNSERIDVEEATAEYVELIDELSQHPKFFRNYCELGRIKEDVETISQWSGVDMSSLAFIKSMLPKNEESSILSTLKELLPHKSETFLQACINKYGDNIQLIMNTVIEENITNESQLVKPDKNPIVIPNKDIIDDNKEHVKLLKEKYLKKDANFHGDKNSFDPYEDEYDDTYDSQNIAAQDADSADEYNDIASRRKFTIPNILRQAGDVTPPDSDSEDGEMPKNERDRPNNAGGGGKYRNNPGEVNRGRNNRGRNRGRGDNRGGYRGNNNGANRGRFNHRNNGRRKEDNRDNNGEQNNEGARNPLDNRPNRGGGRGRGRGRGVNRRALADKKRAGGMMPY